MVRTLDETKRSAILTAAQLIFVRDGVANSKMSEIASRAGVAPGTLYLYFENKEALVSAIGEGFLSRLMNRLVEEIQKIEGPDDVASLIDWAADVGEEEHVFLAMAKERHHNPKIDRKGHEYKVKLVADALTGLTERDIIRPFDNASVLAELLLSFLRRLIMAPVLFGDKATTELKAGAVTVLQRILFDDVTVAANQLLKRKKIQ